MMFDWHLAAVGHLSRNRYWGESEDVAHRDVLATSTIVEAGRVKLLIDPSFSGEDAERALLNARGIRLEDITHIFITHYHFDHHTCIDRFPAAKVYVADGDLAYMRDKWDEYHASWTRDSRDNLLRMLPGSELDLTGARMVELPGHTAGTAGLLFEAPEGRVLAAGDAVMTKEFFHDGKGYINSYNDSLAAESVARAGGIADIIIPGHGEPFLTRAY